MKDHHAHKCPECSHVWEHDRPAGATEAQYKQAHTCQECGTVQFFKHFTSEDQRVDNNIAVLLEMLFGSQPQ
jgi:hypothetical protein